MRNGFSGIYAVCVLLVVAPISAVQAEGLVCEPWRYDSDGGFEGGEHVASTDCWTKGPQQVHGLTVSCSASLRFYADDPAPPQADGEVETTYEVDGTAYVVLSRLETADNAWASYFSPADPKYRLVEALKRAAYVDVSLIGGSKTTRILLNGSRAAIETMEAACQ